MLLMHIDAKKRRQGLFQPVSALLLPYSIFGLRNVLILAKLARAYFAPFISCTQYRRNNSGRHGNAHTPCNYEPQSFCAVFRIPVPTNPTLYSTSASISRVTSPCGFVPSSTPVSVAAAIGRRAFAAWLNPTCDRNGPGCQVTGKTR